MADPTAPLRHAQTPNYPVDGNGREIVQVTPGKWGHTETFALEIPATQAIRLIDAIVNALVTANPTMTEEQVVAEFFPEKTMELVGWLIINPSMEILWVGGPEVSTDFGVPCLAASGGAPGTLGLTSDMNRTYVYSEAAVTVAINIIGANFGGDSKPLPPSHLNPVHPSQNPDPVFVDVT